MKAIIMAGGRGTRVAGLTKNQIPKPMLKISGRPILEWQLMQLKKYGITEAVIVTGYLGEVIREYFGDGSGVDMNISYITENEPLGTAGALYYMQSADDTEDYFFCMGDIFFDFDIDRMKKFHDEKGAFITLLAHPNMHPQDSDLVVIDKDKRVIAFDSKHNVRDYWYDNLVNAGIFIFSPSVPKLVKRPEKLSLEKELIAPILADKKVYAYVTPEYVKDVGTPDRIALAEEDLKSGLIPARNLEKRQKAIFLDRDGTINEARGFIAREEDFILDKNAAEAIRRINRSGYLAVIVTNQPVIARGEATFEDVETIHRKLATLLGREGCYLDDVLYCPHHPDKGFPGEVSELKTECNCRKPKTGMVEEASRRWNIDLNSSWMIGDGTIDMEMGRRAGMKTVLVKTGQAGKDGKYAIEPDLKAADILDAVDMILNT